MHPPQARVINQRTDLGYQDCAPPLAHTARAGSKRQARWLSPPPPLPHPHPLRLPPSQQAKAPATTTKAAPKAAPVVAKKNGLASAAAATVLSAALVFGAAAPALADVSGLTPCASSKQFAARQKKEVKALQKRLKQVRGGCGGRVRCVRAGTGGSRVPPSSVFRLPCAAAVEGEAPAAAACEQEDGPSGAVTPT